MSNPTDCRRAWIEVDLAALVHNAGTLRNACGVPRLLPMVKANAYGVGVRPVVRALEPLDPWGFGVATVEEGAALRRAGVDRPIVVFSPALEAWLPACREWRLRPVLDRAELFDRWGEAFHLEIDTGMGRGGVRWDDRAALVQAARSRPEGVFTHLHSADEDPDSVVEQERRFRLALEAFAEPPALVHVANSAGCFRARGRYDLARPGIFLYGGAAGGPAPRPVVALRARVVSVRALREGDTVSYGAEWRSPRETRVATVGIGYADGVPRAVKGRASVLLRGRRCRMVGRVTMDMTMVDVGALTPEVVPGEVVTLIGTDGDETIGLDEFAGWAGTVSYEILTGLGSRLERRYREA